jgi:Eukaryotic translation initiation factor 3 subunit 8 N-terminus
VKCAFLFHSTAFFSASFSTLQKRQLDADAAAEASAKQGAGAGAAGGAAGHAAAATALLDVASLEGKAGDASAIMGKEWTRESLEKRVKDELASRGRKGVDPKVLSARLTALADVSVRFGPQVSIPFLMHAVSARYDCAKGLDMYLERSAWKRTARDIGAIIGMLEANPALRMVSSKRERERQRT